MIINCEQTLPCEFICSKKDRSGVIHINGYGHVIASPVSLHPSQSITRHSVCAVSLSMRFPCRSLITIPVLLPVSIPINAQQYISVNIHPLFSNLVCTRHGRGVCPKTGARGEIKRGASRFNFPKKNFFSAQ